MIFVGEKKKRRDKKYEFWTDQIARKVFERKKFLYVDKPIPSSMFKKFTVKTSASISGVLHIGRLSDTIRGEAVTRSLLDVGKKADTEKKTEIIWVAEDMDPLRKVPEGIPASANFIEYIGMPVTDIPDPWGCHKSYAEHHTTKYFEVLDKFVMLKMKKFSMREEYKKGNFNPYIKKLMQRQSVEQLVEIQNKYRETKLSAEAWNPWTPICKNCGKIITPRVIGFDAKTGKVRYKCEDYAFEKNIAKGCGYEDENDPLKGEGKLMWKSEWAAQWARWAVCAEGAGKEYQVPGSAFWINAEICERLLDFPAPVPIFYEHLIINGQKMSASLGNVVYPNEWLKYAPAELLRLLFLKDPMRTRDFRWNVLPNMFDELDELEKAYYGVKTIASERDEYNAKRLFEIINIKKIEKNYAPKISFSTMVELAKTLPETDEKKQVEFVEKKIKELKLLGKATSKVKPKITPKIVESVKERLTFAKAYVGAFSKPTEEKPKQIGLSAAEKELIKQLIKAIEEESAADKLQSRIFEISKSGTMPPAEFFKLVYRILFSSDRGPRLGVYIIDAGKSEIIKKLKEVV